MINGVAFSLPLDLVAARECRDWPREIATAPVAPGMAVAASKAAVPAVGARPQEHDEQPGQRDSRGGQRNPRQQGAPRVVGSVEVTYTMLPGYAGGVASPVCVMVPLVAAGDPRAGATFSVLV